MMDKIQEREIEQKRRTIEEINQETSLLYDTVRETVKRIFNMFDSDYCQVCGQFYARWKKSQHEEQYGHKAIPGIELYIEYNKMLFQDSEGEWWGIAARGRLYFYRFKQGLTGWEKAYYRVEDVSMDVLARAVQSFAIPRFLEYYIDELRLNNKNFEKIAKISEAIRETIFRMIVPP